MAGRRAKQRDLTPPSPYKYNSDHNGLAHVQCEESEPYHIVRPTEAQWPPQSKGPDDPRPTTSAKCELCGSWQIFSADNDAVKSGILVITPERTAATATAIRG